MSHIMIRKINIFGGVVLLLLFLGLFTVKTVAQMSETNDIVNVAFCELMKNPEKYDGKVIRVKGIYRNFFELSELFCPECYDSLKRIWVESTEMTDKCIKSKETKRLEKARTLFVVFVGKFQASESSYGHSNGYRFQLDLKCVEKSKVLSKDKPLLPNELNKFDITESCQ